MKKKKKVVRKKNWLQDWFEAILFAFVVAMIIRNYTFQNFKIPSASMESTLLIGDYLVANKLKYYFTDPAREDIVTFRNPADPEEPEPRDRYIRIIPPIYWDKDKSFLTYYERKNVVKRVIGLPGDSVQMINKRVYVNGELHHGGYEQYADRRIIPGRDNYGPVVVPEGKYFMLGDNRDYSLDSRYPNFGFLDRNDVTGTPLIIFWSVGSDGIRWERVLKKIE